MELFREYRYRQLFNCSHDEFLDEPRQSVSWMLAVHNAVGQRNVT